jgi:predicted RND superfamily exporter protein
MREELEHGASYAGAVEATHVHLAKLLFLTSLTTVLGFLALQFAELSFLQDLGLTLAFGILFAFFYSVFLLPALIITYYRIKRRFSSKKGKGKVSFF